MRRRAFIHWRLACSAYVGMLRLESALKIGGQEVAHVRIPQARDSVIRLLHRLVGMGNQRCGRPWCPSIYGASATPLGGQGRTLVSNSLGGAFAAKEILHSKLTTAGFNQTPPHPVWAPESMARRTRIDQYITVGNRSKLEGSVIGSEEMQRSVEWEGLEPTGGLSSDASSRILTKQTNCMHCCVRFGGVQNGSAGAGMQYS